MQALTFLFVRSFINGVKRALTSPKRLISLIFFTLYYVGLVIRPFAPVAPVMPIVSNPLQITLPHIEAIECAVFALFALITSLACSTALTERNHFRPADVDVLFATPVDAKHVLLFRMARQYLIALVSPLFFAIVGWQGTAVGYRFLFANFPTHGGDVLRAAWIAWMLMALGFVAVGTGLGMFIFRSDIQSDINRKRLGWGSLAVQVLVYGYIGLRLRQDMSWENAQSILSLPALRILFFPATAAAAIVRGTLEGHAIHVVFGVLVLLSIIASGLSLAMSQIDWLFDQAAARGFETINQRKLQNAGDVYGLQAARARQGKLRSGRLAEWISRRTVRGPLSLVWKDLVLSTRGSLGVFLSLGLFMVGLTALIAWTTGAGRDPNPTGAVTLSWVMFTVFIFTISSAQTGNVEFLRRGDFQKPLPFSPSALVFWEVAGKAILPAVIGMGCCALSLVISPVTWPWQIAGLILTPSAALVISSVVFLVVVLFPDLDDPTQRGFRGIMMLLGIIIAALPLLGVFLLLTFVLNFNQALAAIPVGGLAIGLAAAISTLSGNLYAGFNPSE